MMLLRSLFFIFCFLVGADAVFAAKAPLGALINDRREMLVLSNGTPVRLSNHSKAVNRSLADVLEFVSANTINRETYTAGRFVCTEYAVSLHDAAERAGIRAGLVSVAFTEGVGHALNVFETTDFGVIFIDCTGNSDGDADDSYDTFGYLEVGKPYGRLHIDLGVRWPSRYSGYEEASSIFKELSLWNQELSEEQAALEQAARDLHQQARNATRRNRAQIKTAAETFKLRVEAYNKTLSDRNTVARSFRLQYSENKAPVARFDVFW